PVAPIGGFPDRSQHVARTPDVLRHDLLHDLLGADATTAKGLDLVVVVVGPEDGVGEDGRVRGDAADRVLFDAPGQFAGLQHLPRDLIRPDADARFGQAVQVRSHTPRVPIVRTTGFRSGSVCKKIALWKKETSARPPRVSRESESFGAP